MLSEYVGSHVIRMRLRHLTPGEYTRVPHPLSALFNEGNVNEDVFYVMGVPADGSCMLHAILCALSVEYCFEYTAEEKREHVVRLRSTLSDLLRHGDRSILPSSIDDALAEHYRNVVQRELDDPNAFLGQEVATVLSNHYHVNMFVIRLAPNGTLSLLPDFTPLRPRRPSLVLLFRDRHYEPIVCLQQGRNPWVDGDNDVRLTGTFRWHDPLIKKMRLLHVLLTKYNKRMRDYALNFGDLCSLTFRELADLYRQVAVA